VLQFLVSLPGLCLSPLLKISGYATVNSFHYKILSVPVLSLQVLHFVHLVSVYVDTDRRQRSWRSIYRSGWRCYQCHRIAHLPSQ